MTDEECDELLASFPLEANKLLDGSLNTAVDHLKSEICTILEKLEVADADDVTIKGRDFPCSMFEQLRSNMLFGTNLIHACLTMSDKLPFVRFGQCISLDEVSKRKIRPIHTPFNLWAKKIGEWRSQSRNRPLAYFCPLLSNANHFSLLEINEIEQKILHYDSMASEAIIVGDKSQPTRLCNKVLEEFGHLNFEYVEAPTPQQRDLSSCGRMVVRNARRRMNGLQVGNWRDILDPERLSMEVVELFNSCISDMSLTKPRKRGRPDDMEDEGIQLRNSKRLNTR